MLGKSLFGSFLLTLLFLCQCALAASAAVDPFSANSGPLAPLGPQDTVNIHIDEDPNQGPPVAVAVSDDGTVRFPYIGPLSVVGLSPDAAAHKAEQALRDGKFFVNPHVVVTVVQSLSQRVSVLGEVKTPGRYPIDSKTTILDLVAQAGGFTDVAGDTLYVSRTDASGRVNKFTVSLKGLNDTSVSWPERFVRGGDSVFVPRANQFYILGEVQKPDMYKLQPNMTVVQAISLAGGVTAKGSARRVEIKRRGQDGTETVLKPKLDDLVEPNDVIRVKESIF